MRIPVFILILFLITVTEAFGVSDPCHKSTEGKDFWFGFMEGRNTAQYSPYTEVTLTSSYTCNFNIYIGKATTPTFSGTVFPNIPLKVRPDWHAVEATGSEIIQERAIHLVSDNPLNVYALNFAFNSSEVATVFPTESLGYEYYTMCYNPHVSIHADPIYGLNIQGKNSEFLVVASEDSTMVTIKPSVVTDKLAPKDSVFNVLLSKGEVYQVQSANRDSLAGQGDLTGSYISSDKPIAIFSGSYSTTIPHSSVSAWDHLFEQMPPIQSWGKRFITVPLKSRHEDTYRVLAAEDNTTIHIGNNSPFVLNKGNFKEFSLLYNQPSLVESDKPVLLAQFSNSNSVDYIYNGGDGDPFMVILSPASQTRQQVAFVAYDSPEITKKFFINVLVSNDVIGKIFLDNKAVLFQPVIGTGYSYAQDSIGKGSHYIESVDPAKGFIAWVYGFGGFEGYGYGVGYNLDIVLDVGGKLNTNGTKSLVRCDGAGPVTLDAGNAFNSYLWSTGETTSSIQVSKAGWYSVKASTIDGCELSDSVELKIDKPVVNIGRDTTLCKSQSIILDAGGPANHYLWSTSDTIRSITVSKSGTYVVYVTDQYGCKNADTINVRVVNNPKMNLSRIDTLVCGKKSEILNISADKGFFTIKPLIGNVLVDSLEVTVPDFGSYPFVIKATDQFSCYSDSTVKISFRDKPTVGFLIDSTYCYQFDPIIRYSGNAKVGISDFIWISGADTISQGIGLDTIRAPIGKNQTISDITLTVTQDGCSNGNLITGIKVTPNLKLSVLDSIGCEPFSAKFAATIAGGISFDWNFGDGSFLNGVNATPTHTYEQTGNYSVQVKATTNKGCINEAGKDSAVRVKPIPSVGFTPLGTECLNKGNNAISYLGSGNLFDRYIWDLTQLDAQEIIQNPKETQGPLIFNLKNTPQVGIGLRVITTYGCKSLPVSVLLKRKPDFSFSASSNGGCVPFATQFTATANDPVDRLNYKWDFGDGAVGTGSKVKHIYDIPDQKYDINLYALSTITGCSDTLQRNDFISSHPVPVAEFSVDHTIVYNDKPTVRFTNLSSGANKYLWDFGDGKSSDQKDPVHDYSATGSHTAILQVYNQFMCSDTASAKIYVAYYQLFPPNAFSPNAPNLIDREYKLSSEGISSTGYHFTIISRWNDVVFDVKDEIKGWDGHMLNGSFAPAGVYVWVLDYTDFLGRKHRQTGTVTLVY